MKGNNEVKKLAIASVVALAMSGVASAQVFFDEDDGADLTLTLNGTVDEICGLTAATDEATIEFGELATTAPNRSEPPSGSRGKPARLDRDLTGLVNACPPYITEITATPRKNPETTENSVGLPASARNRSRTTMK